MFTIAGRPAANVSKSLLGEFVASTGTSLKIVRQAPEAAASSATELLSGTGSRNTTLSAPRSRASRSSAARRFPPPRITNVSRSSSGAAARPGRGRWPRRWRRSSRTRSGCRGRDGRARSRSCAWENSSRSEAFGTSSTRSGSTPAAATPSRMPGDSATTRARGGTRGARARGPAARQRIAQRAHLDRGLGPQVAHLEHERRSVASRGQQRGQRDRERWRGGVDHVGTRSAQCVQRRGDGKPPERQHPARIRRGRGAHVVGIPAARAHHLDAVHLAVAGGRGYHPHRVSAVHEPARELV